MSLAKYQRKTCGTVITDLWQQSNEENINNKTNIIYIQGAAEKSSPLKFFAVFSATI